MWKTEREIAEYVRGGLGWADAGTAPKTREEPRARQAGAGEYFSEALQVADNQAALLLAASNWRKATQASAKAPAPLTVVLAGHRARAHDLAMFVVTEADAAAIRTALHEKDELSAIVELRQRFPGITDHAEARACVRTIAGWQPPPAAPSSVVPLLLRESR